MLNKLTGKARALTIAGAAVIVLAAIALILSLALRVDAAGAQAAALSAVGGGEIVGQEMDREGPWNEYTYQIRSGDTCYEVEVNASGSVTGLESGRGWGGWD